MTKHILPIESKDRPIFELLKSGQKKIETRAGGPKYDMIVEGDILIFECKGESFERIATKVQKFKDVDEMLGIYSVEEINPLLKTPEELKEILENQ
jgi:ASC-1-like (ASCH) protein